MSKNDLTNSITRLSIVILSTLAAYLLSEWHLLLFATLGGKLLLAELGIFVVLPPLVTWIIQGDEDNAGVAFAMGISSLAALWIVTAVVHSIVVLVKSVFYVPQ